MTLSKVRFVFMSVMTDFDDDFVLGTYGLGVGALEFCGTDEDQV